MSVKGTTWFNTEGRYSVEFRYRNKPEHWDRHLILNNDCFEVAEEFYFSSIDTVLEAKPSHVVGIRLFDHEMELAVIETEWP